MLEVMDRYFINSLPIDLIHAIAEGGLFLS